MAEFSTRMGLVYEITVDGKEKLVGALKQAETAAKQTATSAGQIGTKLDAATGSANKFGSSLMSAAKQAVAVYAGVQGLQFIANSVLEQEKAVSALNASLKNTEVYSDKFSKSLQDNATALQKLTIYGDEAIMMGTALMQSVGKLSQEELPRAQKAALGLAAAFGMDIQTAFQLMGKAAAGNTATLSRYGIVLEEGLSASEKFQKILDIGVGKFGLAEAAAKTAAGRFAQFKNSVGDLAETVGAGLLPVIKGLATVLTPIVNILGKLPGHFYAILAVTYLLIKANNMLRTSIIAKRTAEAAAAVTTATATTATVASATAAKGASISFKALGVSMKAAFASNPVGWAIIAASVALEALISLTGEASDELDDFTEKADSVAASAAKVTYAADAEVKKFQSLIDRLVELKKQTSLTANAQSEMQQIITNLNSDYAPYITGINLMAASYQDLATNAVNAANALRASKMATGYAELIDANMAKVADLKGELFVLQEALRTNNVPSYNQAYELLRKWALFRSPESIAADAAKLSGYSDVTKMLNEIEALNKQIAMAEEEIKRWQGEVPISAITAGTAGGNVKNFTGVVAPTETAFDALMKTVSAFKQSISGIAAETETEADKLRKMTSEYLGLVTQLKKLNANTEADSVISEMGRTFERYADSILSDSEDILWKWKNIRSEAAGLDDEYRGQSEAIKSQVEELQALLDMRNINVSPELRTTFGIGEKADIENAIKNLNDARTLLQSEWHREIIIAKNNELLDQLNAQLGLIEDVTISYEKYHEMRSSQIKAEMDLLRARGDIEAGFIDMAEASQMGKIQAEWNERQSNIESDRMNQMIEDNQLLYNSIEGLVSATTNGFARMITEGKSLSETMKNIFQDWVSFAVNELEKLIAKFLIMSIFNALVPGSGSAVGALPGLLNVGSGGMLDAGTSPTVGLASYTGGNTIPTLPAPSANADLLSEIRGLRRDVYAAQPTAVQMNFRKGELSYAVDRDKQNRHII